MPLAQSRQMRQGFGYLLAAFGIVFRHTSVLRLAFLPFAINTLIFAAGIYLMVNGLWEWVTGYLPQGEDLAWYWDIAYWLVGAVIAVGMFGVLFFGFALAGLIVAAPFNDLLSAAVERIVTGKVVEARFTLWQLARYTIASEGRKMAVILIIQISLFVANFVPVVGQAIFLVGTPLFLSAVMAFEFTGYPLDRRGYTFAQKRAYLRSNFWVCFGFGLGVAATLPIPLLNFLLLPVAVTGGTLLALSPPPTDPPAAAPPSPPDPS
ncbi:MAG: EI24 domain-containing protein [Nitrospinae bacterium]|nr:EI24 domain-containing protein [Nitrospinota bacterium]